MSEAQGTLDTVDIDAIERESMEYDVVIVGAGPAGLATAIRLKQAQEKAGKEINVCVLEKAPECGAHTLSGAVIETRALDELLPNWQELGAPITTKADKDQFLFLTENKSFKLPTPPQMHNAGNYIVRLGHVVKWLAEQAESLGVEIYPGFAAQEVLYEDGRVVGVATGDMGLLKDGTAGPNHERGMELRARLTVFAEGCRGHLGKSLMARYDLRRDCEPQVYALGMKELWEIPAEQSKPGLITHSVGWPMKSDTFGGSFLYHLEGNLVSVGFVVGLDYHNPNLFPYMEFQRFKHHPAIAKHLEGGTRISYGARALNEGGFQSIPKLVFPGGILVGCEAGFLNTPKIKGSHTAMKSGMVAADAIMEAFLADWPDPVLESYPEKLKDSWVWEELYLARNAHPAFKWGLYGAIAYNALDTYVFRGRAPWTLHHPGADHDQIKAKADCPPIDYPKPDGVLSFDRSTNLAFSGTNHEENQPCHLVLSNKDTPIEVNLQKFDAPEQRYCPAGVYEIVQQKESGPALQINAQNCLHCKTCDIKDPTQNINWVAPQGGEGPMYNGM